MGEQITFTTSDHVDIVGSWVAPSSIKSSVLLLHMWPADKTSWQGFQADLAEREIASLAIDLRGHGQSSGEASDDARSMKHDVEGALAWLIEQGHGAGCVVGASIGANLALRALADHADLLSAALLSPGLEYHQVTTEDAAKRITPTQALFIAASAGDDQSSADAAQVIFDLAATEKKIMRILQNAGHGTNMLLADAWFAQELKDWIVEHV